MLKSIYFNFRIFIYLRFVFWARWAGMVLALQGQGSCSPISLNLVCTLPPPANVKADGFADTAQKISGFSRYRSPEPRGRYARTSEPP